jgi:hypothetical protein
MGQVVQGCANAAENPHDELKPDRLFDQPFPDHEIEVVEMPDIVDLELGAGVGFFSSHPGSV